MLYNFDINLNNIIAQITNIFDIVVLWYKNNSQSDEAISETLYNV